MLQALSKQKLALVIPTEPGNDGLEDACGLFHVFFAEACSVLRCYFMSTYFKIENHQHDIQLVRVSRMGQRGISVTHGCYAPSIHDRKGLILPKRFLPHQEVDKASSRGTQGCVARRTCRCVFLHYFTTDVNCAQKDQSQHRLLKLVLGLG